MGLIVHRAERSDVLADALAELLADPLPDPFAAEVVAVPAKGIERWLTQRLSLRLGRRPGRADGICAGVEFPSPNRLAASVLGVVEDDPWRPEELVWPLLELIDECADEPWLQLVGRHLGIVDASPVEAGGTVSTAGTVGADHRRGRRYSVAARLAGLFDSYSAHRSPMLRDWVAGRDSDGAGGQLPAELAWQAKLWRRLRRRIPGPDPVERLDVALDRLARDANLPLPQRVSLFGPTRLPDLQVRLLSALATHRDVHLWLPHPSGALWDRLEPEARKLTGRLPRREDPTLELTRHPLLASLGRDSRELQLILRDNADQDIHHPPEADPPPTLLGRLQADLAADRPPAGDWELDSADRSVQVHGCHGPVRQVDVLREVLVGLLAADPTLEPRDILVMCPDIDAYAPLITAAFGLAEAVDDGLTHPGHRLRVRLADRARNATNPVLATLAKLLDLAQSRVTASEVLDLASWPPVRRRFGFDDDALEQLSVWTAESGARWGFDADHRARYGLGQYPQNTWRAGMDRMLVGVAMAEEGGNRLGLALPLDDVGSGDVDLVGRFAEYVDRLQSAVNRLAGPQSLAQWVDSLIAGVESLVRVAPLEAWQLAELRGELTDLVAGAQDPAAISLTLADVRAMVLGRLAGRPTRANFRTGTLTVCTMVPMRSVPHRVICLLGLDDGIFPRHSRPDGDDILARNPVIGDRDGRGEDRQLMLDAILAATDHLVITYSAADERTGAPRPPAVPLGELLDSLKATVQGPAADRIRVLHPLQPFDSANLTPGALGVPGPFSHDRTALSGARALAGAVTGAPAEKFLDGPLPAVPAGDIELSGLIAWATSPVRAFLRQRLEVATRFEDEQPGDAMPVELDNLQKWAIGDRLLAARLSGLSAHDALEGEWRRGTLPPRNLGKRPLTDISDEVATLVDRTGHLRSTPARTVDVLVALPDDRQLRGSVPGVHERSLVGVGYSKLGAKQQLQAWISLLALTASAPEVQWTAVVVGRGSGRPLRATLGPVQPARAVELLTQLVDLYERGLREPLPLPLKTSFEYAQACGAGLEHDAAVAKTAESGAWESEKFGGECLAAEHQMVWGVLSFAELVKIPPAAGERWLHLPSRFAELSHRLWDPLLSHRKVESL